MDIEKLILEVQAEPLLYDKTLPDYKNNLKHEKKWTEIACIMHMNGKYFKF